MKHVTPSGTPLKALAVLFAVMLPLSLSACGSSPQSEDTGRKPIEVVASINQWGSLAAAIGGTDVHVTSIVNTTSTDAHDFEPTTSDIARLQRAQVAVTNGAGYDQWAVKSTAKGTSTVCAATAANAKTGDNPHLWFSRKARSAMADELKKTFSEKLPGKASAFDSRYETWKKSERKIDAATAEFAHAHAGTTYAATESVIYYLLNDMGMKDRTPQGYTRSSASESEPAPSDLQNFRSLLSSREVTMLVNNTQEASDATNMLTGAAGRSEVPVVDVTEQMPKNQTSLTGWILDLVEHVTKAREDFAQTQATHQKVAPGNAPDAGTDRDDARQ